MGSNRHRRAHFIDRRGFQRFELAVAGTAALIVHIWPESAKILFFLALTPFLFRLVNLRSPIRRTSLDIPVLLFVGLAGLGAWAAYNPVDGWNKFWVLACGVLLFYAIAGQPTVNQWYLAGWLCLMATVVSIHFLLGHDWRAQPADIGLINRIGYQLMDARPAVPVRTIHPNAAGGILAVFIPAVAAILTYARKVQWTEFFIYGVASGAVLAFGLLLTSSRAAWLALMLALGIWALWSVSGKVETLLNQDRRSFFYIILGLGSIGAAVLTFFNLDRVLMLINRLPGPQNAGSRLELYQDTLWLIKEYPVLGGGLHSFAGRYSEYILVLPQFFFGYAHNLYLDLAQELGLPGLITVLVLFLAAFGMSVRGSLGKNQILHASPDLQWAILASWVVYLGHGLVDDAFFGESGSVFLLVIPAVSIALNQRTPAEAAAQESPVIKKRTPKNVRALLGGLILAASVAVFSSVWILAGSDIAAVWQANWGAVKMDKIHLGAWPTGKWDEGQNVLALTPVEPYFERALAIDSSQLSANYRLGIIAMLKQDFQAATTHLLAAHQSEPGHPGIHKRLGYSLLWNGQFEEAATQLATIPSAPRELEIYSSWWQALGRNDLSFQAAEMASYLR